ncbi:hypothetical protein LCGC14_2368800 [marine sediment metagenome]|uniref:Winged helix DNA-binding domain-containing protein n=1 Tax=marine sediment metagenome TaxID=412755 RepID=A0A0F9EGV4_9ZZZZ
MILKLSPNERLILHVLQAYNKSMERLELSHETGISDKNISANLNSLELKGLIISQKQREGRSTKRFVQLTSAGKEEKLVKIIIEKKPKKEDIIEKYEKVKTKMQQIKVTDKVMEKLDQFKEREGCFNYSECINRLLLIDKVKIEQDNLTKKIKRT